MAFTVLYPFFRWGSEVALTCLAGGRLRNCVNQQLPDERRRSGEVG